MSSQAVGFMTVVLPKEKVVDFEDWFCEDNPHAFQNISLKMTENHYDYDNDEMREREYQVSCFSLLSTLIENRDEDISVICRELGVERLEIETVNTYEMFRERIEFKDNKCVYSANDFGEEKTEEYELPRKSEMVAE